MQRQTTKMQVTNRNNVNEPVRFDMITDRIHKLMHGGLDQVIDPAQLTQEVVTMIHPGIRTCEIDDLVAQVCASKVTHHIYYSTLASRIVVDNHQKNTVSRFSDAMRTLYNIKDKNGADAPLISKEIIWAITSHDEQIENMIDYNRDFNIDFFGFKTLEKGYLLKKDGICVERPQHLFMRVALGIHIKVEADVYSCDFDEVKIVYDNLSLKRYTHATPTLFHAGSPRPQLSSCFLLDGSIDSVEGIYKTITDCAMISKWAGGIGVHISGIRADGSYIRKTGGHSDGIMPMLKVYNDTARYINQGGGKRPGSFAMYLEPWHPDVLTFLEAKKFHGQEEERARDLFYALWIPDLFMERVKNDDDWSFFDPDECKGLDESYGQKFTDLYSKYENAKVANTVVKAREVWKAIISSQIETGTPYMLYKNSCNTRSNQQHLGTIKSSNLCAEIVEYSSPDEYAVCNLASLCLPSVLVYHTDDTPIPSLHSWTLHEIRGKKVTIFTKQNCGWCKLAKGLLQKFQIQFYEVGLNEELRRKAFFKKNSCSTLPHIQIETIRLEGQRGPIDVIGGYDALWNILKPKIDHNKLGELTASATRNLNKIIDKNFYPIPETRVSNMRHRPIGIGIQGLADLFISLRVPFESTEARKINLEVFETIYYHSMKASWEIAQKEGAYETFEGSPLSVGKFQFDLWEGVPEIVCEGREAGKFTSDRYDWADLREKVMKDGVRNSLLIALMPTASTSQIMGNNECFEPYTSNVYTRRTLAGEFTIINKHLMADLESMDMWNEETRQNLMYHRGSVQYIPELPKLFKELYKTVWEISQKSLIILAAERARFICQSQSLNLWFETIDFKKLTNAHMFGWMQGLKTGSYYVRSKPSISAQSFTIDPIQAEKYEKQKAAYVEEECLSCGS